MTYYNENNQFSVKWLRNLINAGQISTGIVDDRSIEDVLPSEIVDKRCHFFAGIGGWDYALQLAGWPSNIPVWTGSCPCQPFSTAGKRNGIADPRHLWPAWFWLIRHCKPATIIGEQVASKDGIAWLDVVFNDLESCGYSCWATIIPACSIGAPHKRERLYWVGNTDSKGLQGRELQFTNSKSELIAWQTSAFVECTDHKKRPIESTIYPLADGIPARVGRLRGYGNAIVPQLAAEFIRTFMEVVK